ncbi:DNA-binding domain-containing protein [Myxococcota bacterium]|nr:DNA-binding domain-containing protein [Myxococcota bacterium]
MPSHNTEDNRALLHPAHTTDKTEPPHHLAHTPEQTNPTHHHAHTSEQTDPPYHLAHTSEQTDPPYHLAHTSEQTDLWTHPPLHIGRLPEEQIYAIFWQQVGDLGNAGAEHTAPNLRKLQARFMAHIRHPEGPEIAKAHTAGLDPELQRLQNWIAAPNEDFAIQRFSIYANAYFTRLYDILRDFFPRLVEALDEDSFQNLIVDYLIVYPSTHPSAHLIGEHLSDFLRAYPRPNAPHWLPDLVALEWGRLEQFCKPDHPILTQAELAAYPPESWGEMRFGLSPACALLHLQSPAYRIWLALHDKTPLPPIPHQESPTLVWRSGFSLSHESLTSSEASAFQMLQSGADFNTFCGCFLADEAGEQQELTQEILQRTIQKAYTCFGRWLGYGLFTEILPA